MTYLKNSVTCLALGVLLSGCVSMSAVPAGEAFKAETAFTVTPTKAWTRMPDGLNVTKGSALTQDGVPLGAVYLVTAKDGKAMIDNLGGGTSLPRYAEGSTALEHVDFLKASITKLGFSDVVTSNVRPTKLGGGSGTEFNLTGKYPNGLNMKGNVALVESEDGLNIVLYAAPAIHYYDKYKLDAEAIKNSVTF